MGCKNLSNLDYIWTSSKCICENDKYLGNIISNSAIAGVEIIEVTKIVSTETVPIATVPTKTIPIKTVSTNFNQKWVTRKIKMFFILITILIITLSVLIAVSKQGHLLPYYDSRNKWKETDINNVN